LEEITHSLQAKISELKFRSADPAQITSIEVPRGDYSIQQITIPRDTRLVLFSRGRVRLLYVGKRNRPLFALDDNSLLVLREKLEIYYNTNNLQEVTRLMIRCPKTSRVEISKDLKISLFSLKQPE